MTNTRLIKRENASPHLVRMFWLVLGAFVVYSAISIKEADGPGLLSGSLLGFFVLLPAYLWCIGAVKGIPILPLHAVLFFAAFVLPLISNPPSMAKYNANARIEAALAASLYLGIATLVWFCVVRIPTKPPRRYFSLELESADGLLLAFLCYSCIFQLNNQFGWLDIPQSLRSGAAAAAGTLAVLSIAVLSYRWGKGIFSPGRKAVFAVLLIGYVTFLIAGLMIVVGLSMLIFAVVMYTMGSRRLPVFVIVGILAVFSILHLGKDPMRAQYWQGQQTMKLEDFPSFFVEWVGNGLDRASEGLRTDDDQKSDKVSIVERAGLIHMLILVQSKTPEPLPFLQGETYAIIPELLVPRLMSPDKAWTHEGTYILSTYYGLQTREATRTTTIGFGLLAESYANFGYVGIVLLAIVMGLGMGWVTRLAMDVPLLSLRGLFAIVVLTNVIQLETPASVFVTAIYQATLILLGVAFPLMQSKDANESHSTIRAEVALS